jgi:proline dehydrogenase
MGNLEPMTTTPSTADSAPNQLDFSDTRIAFSTKTDKELKKTRWLFKLMNKSWLVDASSKLGLFAVKYNLPFARLLTRKTIFEHFVGGEHLLDCQESIDKLYKANVFTMLDYGAEGKQSEEDLDGTRDEFLRAIEFAASNDSVPVVTIKMSGLTANELLEQVQAGAVLSDELQADWDRMRTRVNDICSKAYDLGVDVFVDAEESWIQDSIDQLALEMMSIYNKDRVTVYNTYQMYRHDRLARLEADYQWTINEEVLFGVKLVRGAYMDKERERARERGYDSPIQVDKEATDRDFDTAVRFCLGHYERIAICCASHNAKSNLMMAQYIEQHQLDKSHSHLNFCQLYGMSDNITYNLADAGYNVAKYVPYGPITEVIPYLIRRAQENSSVTGDMTRELGYIEQEYKRRGL